MIVIRTVDIGIEFNKAEMIAKNRLAYRKPPSIKLIEKVVNKSKLRKPLFERAFGLPIGTIKQCKYRNNIVNGKSYQREMPSQYWHIFYDYDNLIKKMKEHQKKQKEMANEKIVVSKESSEIINKNKAIINEYRKDR